MNFTHGRFPQPKQVGLPPLCIVETANRLDSCGELLSHIAQNVDNALLGNIQIDQRQRRNLAVGGFAPGDCRFVFGGLPVEALLLRGVAVHAFVIGIQRADQAHPEGVGSALLDRLQRINGLFHQIRKLLCQLSCPALIRHLIRELLFGRFQSGKRVCHGLRGTVRGKPQCGTGAVHKSGHKRAVGAGRAEPVQRLGILIADLLLIQHQIAAKGKEIGLFFRQRGLKHGAKLSHRLFQRGEVLTALAGSGLPHHSSQQVLHPLTVTHHKTVNGTGGVILQFPAVLAGGRQCILVDGEEHILCCLERGSGIGMSRIIGTFILGLCFDDAAERVEHTLIRLTAGAVHCLIQTFQTVGQFFSAFPAVGLILQQHGLGQLLADTHDGIQAGQGVLKDHGDFVAADMVEVLFADLQQVFSVIEDLAALHNGIGSGYAQNGLAGGGLARAGLAHDGQCLTLVQVEGDITNRLQLSVDGSEGDRQIFDLKLLFCTHSSDPLNAGLNASRRPLPNRLKEISRREINNAGKKIMWG